MNKELLTSTVYNNPIPLLSLVSKESIDYVNSLLPYSTGFEIECNYNKQYNIDNFKSIPNILAVNNDSSEQRYRIPNGLKGILCLYTISQQLAINSEENKGSGIHYHIDCTDCFEFITERFLNENSEWILKELDTWNYQGTYNLRKVSKESNHNWLRGNEQFKTMEFRIGEMTFDYKILIKRILHCNAIIKHLKDKLGVPVKPSNYDINKLEILEYLKGDSIATIEIQKAKANLKKLTTEETNIQLTKEEIFNKIKNRVKSN